MAIESREDLAAYALRQLGGGVINIEVSDDQLGDAVENAVQFYHEYHFDGIERDYVKHQMTGTRITVPDGSLFQVGELVQNTTSGAQILEINVNVLTLAHTVGTKMFAAGDSITGSVSGTVATISAVTLGDVDKGYVGVNEFIAGVIKVINLTSILGTSDMLFNAQYQIMAAEMQNLTGTGGSSGGTSYLYSSFSYLAHLDFILRKEKTFRFNRRMGRIYLDIDWANDVKVGDYLVFEVYKYIDDESFPAMLDDVWLKKYTTALVKRQWGNNLKKYEGMQMPGGMTYNGQKIYDEAVEEIALHEKEAIESSAPLEFAVG